MRIGREGRLPRAEGLNYLRHCAIFAEGGIAREFAYEKSMRAEFQRYAVVRAGMTLVELLVVIAIIGVLVALVLPAVQAAREAARLTECKSNLREIAIAMTAYDDCHRSYPIGYIGRRQSADKRCISWNVQILPFLELSALWASFDFKVPSYDQKNASVRNTVLKTFLCPSTPQTELYSLNDLWKGAAFTDYGGIYGVEGAGRDSNQTMVLLPDGSRDWQPLQTLRNESLGVMLFEEAVAPLHIDDGLSKTVSIAEIGPRRTVGCEWVSGLNIFAQEQSTPVNGIGLGKEIGSPHPGGALAAFCDGHVEFLAEALEQPVLNAMLTKAGGE